VQAAQVVFEDGSYYGGPSWDNRYLSTGWPSGRNAFILDLQNNANGPRPVHTMRVKKSTTNVDTFVVLGACNVSRSASRFFSNTILYYDYSSLAITNAGCYHPLLGTWGLHSKLFISRSDGEDIKTFDVPVDHPVVPSEIAQGKGEVISKAWSDPEWSNHPYYAAAGLLIERLFSVNGSWEQTQNYESIYLVNLKDSLYCSLIESIDTSSSSTTQFLNPFLWVETPADFQEDTTWLALTIWQRAGQGVLFHEKGHNSFNPRAAAFAGKTINGISLYSMTGRRIFFVKHAACDQMDPQKVFGAIPSGVYIMAITVKGINRPWVRLVVEK
jgi:hypothetical protein